MEQGRRTAINANYKSNKIEVKVTPHFPCLYYNSSNQEGHI